MLVVDGDLRAAPSAVVASAASRIGGPPEAERRALVRELQARGDHETFDVAVDLARSGDPQEVELGLEVIGQLGYREGRPWLEESLPIVLATADTDSPAIAAAAIAALAHLGDERGLPATLAHARSRHVEVRLAVAQAIPWVGGRPLHPDARQALLGLMADPADEVRDWATFGLGVLTADGGDDVRDALLAHLHDPGANTAGEALVGLARRGDRRIVEQLLVELAGPDVGNLTIEAACELGDPALLPALEHLARTGWAERDARGDLLVAAITACGGRPAP